MISSVDRVQCVSGVIWVQLKISRAWFEMDFNHPESKSFQLFLYCLHPTGSHVIYSVASVDRVLSVPSIPWLFWIAILFKFHNSSKTFRVYQFAKPETFFALKSSLDVSWSVSVTFLALLVHFSTLLVLVEKIQWDFKSWFLAIFQDFCGFSVSL